MRYPKTSQKISVSFDFRLNGSHSQIQQFSNLPKSFLGILHTICTRLESSSTFNEMENAHTLKCLFLTLENYRREQRSA